MPGDVVAPRSAHKLRLSTGATGGVVPDRDDETVLASALAWTDPRDYDVDHYVRVLHDTFASRLARAFADDDNATVFSDPEQPSLFERDLQSIRTVLVRCQS